MSILKRFTTLLICLMIVFMPVLNGFTIYVSADSVPVGYTQVDSPNELTNCFLAYCKSRDTNIVGGGANIVANFTYSMILDASRALGINLTTLQAELYYKQESNQGIQWFMTSTGVTAFNQIFARLITEKGLDAGDTANENLYSGLYYVDGDGIAVAVFDYNANKPNYQQIIDGYSKSQFNEKFDSLGTFYKYSSSQLNSLYTSSQPATFKKLDNSNVSRNLVKRGRYDLIADQQFNTLGYNNGFYGETDTYTENGYYCVGRFANQLNNLYLCTYTERKHKTYNTTEYDFWCSNIILNVSASTNTTNVNINLVTINNNTIKNEYDGDTYINNEGDIINEGDEGDDNSTIIYNPYPDNPNYNPSNPDSGTTTGPSSGNGGGGTDGTINFPDIDFNLPEINWSLGDLSNKFPFSIPFDLVNLVTVLDAPAEAPRFEGTVNFGFTTWDYDINLESFDTVASVCRTTELVLFIFGLILITRNLIKG